MKSTVGVFGCLLASTVAGCWAGSADTGRLEYVWGRRGISEGRLQKPRAMAIDEHDHLYLVDMTARIQVFDTQGRFLRGWRTPEHRMGKPTGLSIGREGNVLVADTHYYRVLIYSPDGRLLRVIGEAPQAGDGAGPPGQSGRQPLAVQEILRPAPPPARRQFELVLDVVQDPQGNYYVSQMGEYDCIQKFSPEGEFLLRWGGHGSEPGRFARPQNLAIDEQGQIWVADACNHRIQVFDSQGNLVRIWGVQGGEPGQLQYPYDLALGPDATVYVCEYGNHRVQKFTRDGRFLASWGAQGRREGQLYNPWALARDSRGKIHVLDTNNHRVQCIEM